MKISVLMSLALTPLAFIGTAHAQPDLFSGIPEDLGSCLSKASGDAAGEKRCYARQKCFTKHSTSEEALNDCVQEAEAEYEASLGRAYEGTSPYQPSPAPEEKPLTSTSVSTDIADSRYEERDQAPGFVNH